MIGHATGRMVRRALLGLCVIAQSALADADSGRAAEVAKAVNAFAVAHHRLLPAGNALVSPWSIETNMAMLYGGADGATREAMQKALFFPADEAALHTGFRNLREALLAKPARDIPLQIRVANRLFHDQSFTILPSFMESARANYDAEAVALDFRGDASGEEKRINRWVNDETAGKIPAIIPDGTLGRTTRLVLVNAVYFDVPWDERFTKELTQEQPFFVDAAHFKTAPLMFKQHRLGYAKKDGFQIAALPYVDGTCQFVVFLPDAVDGLARMERAITGELLSECAKLPATEVRLSLPRIRMAPPGVNLTESLKTMGAGVMFGDANFSRLTKENVAVSDVFHRTFVELDEDGTKAAAATATILIPKNGHPREVPHQVVKADHPFLFMIQHVPSGTCLFLGRLADPAPETAAVAGRPALETRDPPKKK